MATITAKEAKDKFGQMIESAQHEPVTITKHNRPTVVMVSSERYAELEALEDRYWVERADKAAAGGFLSPDESVAFLKKKIGGGTAAE